MFACYLFRNRRTLRATHREYVALCQSLSMPSLGLVQWALRKWQCGLPADAL
jgi:hypothetical protein